jgi:hypothetical protein
MYTFNVTYNESNKITVVTNTHWSCYVDGNFRLSSYNGFADGEDTTFELDIIVPLEIPIIDGNIIFTYGDERCEYPVVPVYQINGCILSTIPSYITTNGRREIYFNFSDEGQTMSLTVQTAYGSATSWTANVNSGDAKIFTTDEQMLVIAGKNESEIELKSKYCDDSVYVILCNTDDGGDDPQPEKKYTITPSNGGGNCNGGTQVFRVSITYL